MTIIDNTTSIDRKAKIKIDYGGATVSIAVEQKGATVDDKPYNSVITLAEKGSIAVTNIK